MIDTPVQQADLTKFQPPRAGYVEAIYMQNLQHIANSSLILFLALFLLDLYASMQDRGWASVVVGFILFLLVLSATFFKTFHFMLRAWLLVTAYWFAGTGVLIMLGLNPIAIPLFIAGILIASFLLPGNNWSWLFVLTMISTGAVTFLSLQNLLPAAAQNILEISSASWLVSLAILLFAAYMLASAIAQSYAKLRSFTNETLQIEHDLTEKNGWLDFRRIELEKDLDQRNSSALAARQITREISKRIVLEEIMEVAVEQISAHFNGLHTGIFLKDERGEYALFKAGSGEASKEMLARHHKLRLPEEGIVGTVMGSGERKVVADVEADPLYARNPSLPLTRSEITVPLQSGGQVIGVIDLQSENPNQFDEEDARTLQTIADYLAFSIDKTKQLDELNQKVEEFRLRDRQSMAKSWQAHFRSSRKQLGYRYSGAQITPFNEPRSSILDNLTAGEPKILPVKDENGNLTDKMLLSVPIKLRDQVLGMVDLKYSGKSVPEEITGLVNAAVDRLALALENARLLEEIQQRADREHTIANISDRVRAASDIESILKTTVEELGRSMGVGEVKIQLKTVETK